MIVEAEIGKRIKESRQRKKIRLQDLSESTGLTKGYLSKIENSAKTPPLSTLIMIANALDTKVSELLGERDDTTTITLVRASERPGVAKDATQFGYSYEALAHKFHSRHMEPFVLTHKANQEEKPLFQHKGEELVFVLEGAVTFSHGEKEFILKKGDSVYFDAGVPHTGVCHGNREAKLLVVIYTPDK